MARLERQMAAKGFLEGSQMSSTFDLLRANDLIFSYVTSNWLMGGQPPAFDLLAWNGDSTRLPAVMHSFYLRTLYIDNQLARGEMELGGQHLSLPGRQERRVGGGRSQRPHRAVAGVVNPPGPKAQHEVARKNRPTAAEWRAAAEARSGSWWEDWTEWARKRAGKLTTPPPMGSRRHHVLGEAPGDYVHG